MDATGIGILIGLACVLSLFIGWWRWQQYRLNAAKRWPQSEATIETGGVEVVASHERVEVKLPVFTFSYQVKGEYYSGRFALMPYTVDYGDAILSRMAGRKVAICYNPEQPEKWVIPDEMIDGYKVEQKMGPHFVGFYPNE